MYIFDDGQITNYKNFNGNRLICETPCQYDDKGLLIEKRRFGMAQLNMCINMNTSIIDYTKFFTPSFHPFSNFNVIMSLIV